MKWLLIVVCRFLATSDIYLKWNIIQPEEKEILSSSATGVALENILLSEICQARIWQPIFILMIVDDDNNNILEMFLTW